MTRARTVVGSLALAAALAAPALARAEDGPTLGLPVLRAIREVHRRIEALGVTTGQKEKIKAVLRSHRDELRGAVDRVWEAHEAVGKAIHQDGVDEALIRQRVQEAAAAHADLAVLRARVRNEARAVLTPAQRQGTDGIRDYVHDVVLRLRNAFRAFVDESL